jgi:hypothetical protein
MRVSWVAGGKFPHLIMSLRLIAHHASLWKRCRGAHIASLVFKFNRIFVPVILYRTLGLDMKKSPKSQELFSAQKRVARLLAAIICLGLAPTPAAFAASEHAVTLNNEGVMALKSGNYPWLPRSFKAVSSSIPATSPHGKTWPFATTGGAFRCRRTPGCDSML